jgi:hypothetical protein
MFAADIILAALDILTLDQVRLSPKNLTQLVLDMHHIEKAIAGARGELHEHVHIALRTKVISQNRSEKSQFCNASPLAKLHKPLVVNCDSQTHISPEFRQFKIT